LRVEQRNPPAKIAAAGEPVSRLQVGGERFERWRTVASRGGHGIRRKTEFPDFQAAQATGALLDSAQSPRSRTMSQPNQFALLGKRRFLPFFLTQALGAFNDNVFKNALVIMITFKISGLSQGQVNTLANLAAALFILPFFLLSANAGQWAEKYEKSRSIRWIKLLEIAVMVLAATGFW